MALANTALDNLLIGFYKVTVKSTDFRTTTVQVEVQLNTTATANVTLSPGAANEVVEVSGAVPIIDTTTPQIQSTYENKQLQDLPTAAFGMGVLNLSLLQSGVGSTGGLGAGTGPSVGGQRPRNNNFTIEGVDNNDKGETGPLAYVPNDAVANFTVLQNQLNAEFGHSNGGQFNTVVLSGTNTFHGRAYEYFINRNLNAVDQSLANEGIFTNPRFDDNRFGGRVGGPILKNKLFFFANYEYNPVGEASSPGSPILAPTAEGYSTTEAAASRLPASARPTFKRSRSISLLPRPAPLPRSRHKSARRAERSTCKERRFSGGISSGGARLLQRNGADYFNGLQHQWQRPNSWPLYLQ